MQQLPDAVVAARAKARQEAEDKLQRQAEEWLRGLLVVLAATTAPTNSPIPVPETAENRNLDSGRGDLKFKSRSSVREIAALDRSALKPLGYKEMPTIIDGDSMVELDFSRQGKRLFVTIHRLGSLTDVRSDRLPWSRLPASSRCRRRQGPQPARRRRLRRTGGRRHRRSAGAEEDIS